jgi:hypothetical protein
LYSAGFLEWQATGITRRRRSAEEQSRHDEAVRRSAAQYEARGYRVMADVPGFDRPDLIQGCRPDLIVQKGREKKVVEVETPSTLEADRAQQETLRRGAQAMGAEFRDRGGQAQGKEAAVTTFHLS